MREKARQNLVSGKRGLMDGWVGGCGLTELWAQGYFGKKAPEKTFPELEKLVRTSILVPSFVPCLAFGSSCKLFELLTKRDFGLLLFDLLYVGAIFGIFLQKPNLDPLNFLVSGCSCSCGRKGFCMRGSWDRPKTQPTHF